ncbi:MAG: response regulator transcription factor [Candidatus Binatia bacterium]
MNFEKNTSYLAGAAAAEHAPDLRSPNRNAPLPSGTRMHDPDRIPRALTEREKQILRLVCDGLSNASIAGRLGVSPETVKSELKRIFRKIEVKNRTQAAVLLVRQGLV